MRKINRQKLIFAFLLIGFAVIGRYLLLDIPNVETMTAAALLAGALLGGGYTLLIPLASVAAFDLFYGNSPILLFTWSAWAIIGFFGLIMKGRDKTSWKFTAGLTGMGIVSSLFFFFWTNFGVWLIGTMYPKTASGLFTSYLMGIPFLRMQVLGNLIVVPIAATALHYLWKKMRVPKPKAVTEKKEVKDLG